MTRVHHCIARFGPQGLHCNSSQGTHVYWSILFLIMKSQSTVRAASVIMFNYVTLIGTYIFSSCSSKANNSVEPKDRIWKQCLIGRVIIYFIISSNATGPQQVFISQLSSSLTFCLCFLDEAKWTGCGTGIHTTCKHKINTYVFIARKNCMQSIRG